MEKILKHPWLIVLLIAFLTLFFAFQLPRLELDNNNFRFISKNDPARLMVQYIDNTFGSSIFILVALERKTGDIFDPVFLSLVKEYVDKIEAIKIIDPVTSIVTADYITGDSESIIVEKLLSEDFSGKPEEIALLKEKLLSWDIYKRALISDDFSSTQILVPLNVSSEDAGKPEVMNSFILVRDIAREMFTGTAEVYVTGIPVISATINEAVKADLVLLVPLVIIVVLVTLFFSFRRLAGVVLPLLAVMVAAIWSMGIMSLFRIKLSIISTVLPVILVAVGSAYGIHVITRYLDSLGKKETEKEEYRELIINSVMIVAKPVFLAALTTLAGFLSFCFTTVVPIREFGIFAGLGVVFSFIIALSFIPSLLILKGPPKMPSGKRGDGNTLGQDRFSIAVSHVFSAIAGRKGLVFCIAGIIIVISVYGTSRLIIDNVFIEYFKSDTDIAKSDQFIREQFGGSKIISIVAEAERSEVLLNPACLLAMDNLNRHLEAKIPEVGKTNGFTDLIKRINQVFNADENPEGIKPSSFPGNTTEPEYGELSLDFGFGNFGFDDEDDFGFGNFDNDSPLLFPAEGPNKKQEYSLYEIIALLSKASRSGKNANPSAEELITELKKLVNFEGAAYYEIPSNPAKYGKTTSEELAGLVSNYLILLSGSISSYANDPLEPTAIKTTVQLRTMGESDTNRAVEAVYSFIKDNFPKDINVIVGGSALVESSLNHQVVNSQIISLFISLVLVFLIVALSNRSFIAGFIGIIPLSISILINFAVMGFLGIKLNLVTSMIASLAVGIGIDYTIHYMESFKREYDDPAFSVPHTREQRDFLARTFAVSGKAIIINALSVGAGFAVLIFSNFNMLGDFGLLIAVTMGISALVSLTVIPALLLTLKPAFVFTGKNKNNKTGD